MIFFHSALLEGNLGDEEFDFMFLRLAQTDDVHIIAALRVSHMHHRTVQPAKQIDALFAIVWQISVWQETSKGVNWKPLVGAALHWYMPKTRWWERFAEG